MGLLTRWVRTIFLDGLSLVSCTNLDVEEENDDDEEEPDQKNHPHGATGTTTDHPDDDKDHPHNSKEENPASDTEEYTNSPQELATASGRRRRPLGASSKNTIERGKLAHAVEIMSVLFDLLDIMNFVIDMIFVIRLFQLPDSIAYAALLLAGLILSRLVVYRATNVMYRGGIDWAPFWIEVSYKSNKNKQAYALLYCLVFSEAAVFLLEDYPSLIVYAHWPVINFPPAPLEELDNYNVALSALSLCVLLALFLIAILASLFLLNWKEWTWRERCINGTKVALFLTGCVFLARFVMEMVIGAWEFTFRNVRQVPSNEILFFELCEPETLGTRYELCDERIFVVKVVIAWITAGIFIFYLFFKPATYAVEGASFYLKSRKTVSNFFSSFSRSGRTMTSRDASLSNYDYYKKSTNNQNNKVVGLHHPDNSSNNGDKNDEDNDGNGDDIEEPSHSSRHNTKKSRKKVKVIGDRINEEGDDDEEDPSNSSSHNTEKSHKKSSHSTKKSLKKVKISGDTKEKEHGNGDEEEDPSNSSSHNTRKSHKKSSHNTKKSLKKVKINDDRNEEEHDNEEEEDPSNSSSHNDKKIQKKVRREEQDGSTSRSSRHKKKSSSAAASASARTKNSDNQDSPNSTGSKKRTSSPDGGAHPPRRPPRTERDSSNVKSSSKAVAKNPTKSSFDQE